MGIFQYFCGMNKRIFSFIIFALASVSTFSQVPDVSLRKMDGGTVRLQSLVGAGHPTVVTFFATWCKPCMRELNALADVYGDWQSETGVEVIAVSLDKAQDIEKVKPLVDGNGWDFTVLLDPEGEFGRLMQVQSIPHVFIYDKSGKLLEQHTGYTDGSEEEILKIVKSGL